MKVKLIRDLYRRDWGPTVVVFAKKGDTVELKPGAPAFDGYFYTKDLVTPLDDGRLKSLKVGYDFELDPAGGETETKGTP